MQPSMRWVIVPGFAAVAVLVALVLWQGRQASLVPNELEVAVATAPSRQIGAEGGHWYDYQQAYFAEDVKAGRTVMVAVHADWCTDCRAQAPVITRLIKEPRYDAAVGYVVDFDREREFLAEHKVRTQSTLIIFKNGEEVGRAVAITSEKDIRALFEQGL
jgi:thioredoxin 1